MPIVDKLIFRKGTSGWGGIFVIRACELAEPQGNYSVKPGLRLSH